jgi:hypothetical protein
MKTSNQDWIPFVRKDASLKRCSDKYRLTKIVKRNTVIIDSSWLKKSPIQIKDVVVRDLLVVKAYDKYRKRHTFFSDKEFHCQQCQLTVDRDWIGCRNIVSILTIGAVIAYKHLHVNLYIS